MNPNHVLVHLALNDWRNGAPQGYALGLQIADRDGDIALALDTVTGDSGPVCRVDQRLWRVKLGYHWYAIKGYRQWYGNWCWDAVWMEPSTAADLLNQARASKWWRPDSGYTSYWERWESDEPFTAAFFTAEALINV